MIGPDKNDDPRPEHAEAKATATAVTRLDIAFAPATRTGKTMSAVELERVAKAQWLYDERTRRVEHFGGLGNCLTEAPWDLLLDLFTRYTDVEATPVISASLGGRVPPTTGLRWIAVLEEGDWVRSFSSDSDRRVRLLRLTPKAVAAMADYLDGISFPAAARVQGSQEPD